MREARSREHFLPHFAVVTCHLSPACRAGALREGGSLAESGYENTHRINHNSVRDIDRDSLICADLRRIARWCGKLCRGSEWPAEYAGDDEADDGDV